ncbi:exopolysaccharide production repressor protein [Mesorhizobium sp. B2-4-17]|uniref:exopolysaccharide production repressor protein n=1 Tax=Mesorhizobium sp. B2-4-17 TaxID=2589932 RepID=UPI001128F5DE|nr:exopolysaccharide production repressor protein [Mesorhizobium sp. B2-4-17]TPK78095.1 hypothetical protein FJ548_25725 [Mesorhizobium sp. B2-4-17]
MYFPQFLIGMFGTLGFVAVWIFAATGSLWHALGWTAVAAIVLQIGYFVAVMMLVIGGASRKMDSEDFADSDADLPAPFEHDGVA